MEVRITKNIKNDDILIYLNIIEKLQIEANDSIISVIKQSQEIKFRPVIIVAISILKRIIECSSAIRVLSLTGFSRDAAILLLNLLELKLDIMYINQDDIHADEWLNHEKENRKPWKVSFLLEKLYPDERELKAEQDIYRKFSMIKHGNPVGGISSFPIEITNRSIVLRKEFDSTKFLTAYLFGCGSVCYAASKAFICISKKHGFDLKEHESKIDFYKKELSSDSFPVAIFTAGTTFSKASSVKAFENATQPKVATASYLDDYNCKYLKDSIVEMMYNIDVPDVFSRVNCGIFNHIA